MLLISMVRGLSPTQESRSLTVPQVLYRQKRRDKYKAGLGRRTKLCSSAEQVPMVGRVRDERHTLVRAAFRFALGTGFSESGVLIWWVLRLSNKHQRQASTTYAQLMWCCKGCLGLHLVGIRGGCELAPLADTLWLEAGLQPERRRESSPALIGVAGPFDTMTTKVSAWW